MAAPQVGLMGQRWRWRVPALFLTTVAAPPRSTGRSFALPPPHSVLTVFLPLVSSPEVPQGLFQRDAPVSDVPAAHRQGGADTVQTHRLRVLAVLQEGRLRLQQPRDGVGPVMGPRHAVPSHPSGSPTGGLDPSPLPPSA